MENKFTLNSALKDRWSRKRNIDLVVFLLLIIFILLNFVVINKENRKRENIAMSTIEREDTIFDTYKQIRFEDSIFVNDIAKMLNVIEKLDCDEIVFLPEGVTFFYQMGNKYEQDFLLLKEEFLAVYILSIDKSGTKIEVQYE